MMLLEPCVPCFPGCGSVPFGAMSLTGDKHGLCPWLAAVKPGIRSHGEHPGICTCQTTQIAAVNEPLSGPITGHLSQYQFGGLFQTPHHGKQHGTRDESPGLGSAGNRRGGTAQPSLPHDALSYQHWSLPRLCHTGILKTEQDQPPARHHHLNKHISCTKLHTPQTYPDQ